MPNHEVVNSRVIHLPNDGGIIGRQSSCAVYLPDQSRTISRNHCEIQLLDNKYMLVDISNNGVSINNKHVARGKQEELNDGDIISIQGYKLLVSIIDLPSNNNKEKIITDLPKQRVIDADVSLDFTIDEGDFVEDDVIEVGNEQSIIKNKKSDKTQAKGDKNILVDDPFDLDPFELDTDDIEAISTELVTDNADLLDDDIDNDRILSSQNNDLSVNAIKQFIAMEQRHNFDMSSNRFNHEKLFEVMEITVKEFLDEFNPEILEAHFESFNTSWSFIGKEKRCWKIYRKFFRFRHDNGEYLRLFKSLLIENLQKQQKE